MSSLGKRPKFSCHACADRLPPAQIGLTGPRLDARSYVSIIAGRRPRLEESRRLEFLREELRSPDRPFMTRRLSFALPGKASWPPASPPRVENAGEDRHPEKECYRFRYLGQYAHIILPHASQAPSSRSISLMPTKGRLCRPVRRREGSAQDTRRAPLGLNFTPAARADQRDDDEGVEDHSRKDRALRRRQAIY